MSRAFRHGDRWQEILYAQASRDRCPPILLGEALLGRADAGASREGGHLFGEVGVSYADAAGKCRSYSACRCRSRRCPNRSAFLHAWARGWSMGVVE